MIEKGKMKGEKREVSEIFIKSFERSHIRNPLVYSRLARYPVLHTVEILKIWEDQYRFYTAEKWIRGKNLYETLREWVQIRDEKRLRTYFCLLRRWRSQIQTAVDGLHCLPGGGIIHGDISPKNIMVTDEKKAMLIDFNGADFNGGNQSNHWFATKAFSQEDAYFQGILTEESDWIAIEKTFSFARHILYLSLEVGKNKNN